MEKSEYARGKTCGCGCSDGGLGQQAGLADSGCGCQQGLGGTTPNNTSEKAPETQKDLISEAKKYINGEIPAGYKIAAGIAVIILLTLAKKKN